MEPNKQKRKIRLPFSAVLLYLALTAILLSGVTFSRYMTKTTIADTARVASMKNITITETGNFTEQNKWVILPGVNLNKNAVIHFDGSEMACYVFLEIETAGWQRTGEYAYACPIDGTEALSWTVDPAWAFLIGDDGGAVYYRIVSADNAFDARVLGNDGTILVDKSLTRTQLAQLTEHLTSDLSIEIGATAVQYHGFPENPEDSEQARARAVWQLVSGE